MLYHIIVTVYATTHTEDLKALHLRFLSLLLHLILKWNPPTINLQGTKHSLNMLGASRLVLLFPQVHFLNGLSPK